MTRHFSRSPIVWSSTSILVIAGVLSSHGGGVQSGSGSVPVNASRAMPSCSSCHSASQPFAGRTDGPTVSLTASALVLTAGQQITVTTAGTGGIAGTRGGFLCEATSGAFTAGTNSHVNPGNTSITHSNNNARSWVFTYTAPATVGLVELTSVVQATNASGSSGDRFAFSGFDKNATVGTPVRLFVLPAGVANTGTGCADGYGNHAVLGASGSPTVGNSTFAFQLFGASPSALAFLFAGFNPPGFTGVDLGLLFGITGCTGYVASPIATQTAFTSGGVPARGDGNCTFPLPLPNNPALRGITLDLQAAYIDTSVPTRAVGATFANGLRMVVQ